MTATKYPTLFISHGGGPWSYMEGEYRRTHAQLEASLAEIPRRLPATPKAILMISGHWVEADFTVMSSSNPPMIYDYSGFPESTYYIHYAAPGSPELAGRIQSLLGARGIKASSDSQRGFDHGAFVPLHVIYPQADVPVVQLSLKNAYNVEAHIEAGRALAPLREEGVLIMGSGLSYHNLRRLAGNGRDPSHAFDGWLNQTVVDTQGLDRYRRLMDWSRAPSAREAHPDEDHLLPLMVVIGASENEPGKVIYHQDDFFGALAVSSFAFGLAEIDTTN